MSNYLPVIDTETHQAALVRIEELFDIKINDPRAAELDALVDAVVAYEEKTYPDFAFPLLGDSSK